MEQVLGTILGGALGFGLVFWCFKGVIERNFLSNEPRKPRIIRKRAFSLNMSYEEALEKSKKAIRSFDIKMERFNEEKGELRVLTKNFYSWGEIITIRLFKGNGGNTAVEVESSLGVYMAFN